jgi:hypothetical protein
MISHTDIPIKKALSAVTFPSILTLILLPIIIGLFYIHSFGVNVPFLDQWNEFPAFLMKYENSDLSIFDLFSQQNESRPFFPRIFMFSLSLITSYNVKSLMYLSYGFYCISFFILFSMYKKDHGVTKLSLLKFVPIAWFFFNLFQMSNFLFGIRTEQSLHILAFISAVYLIDSSKKFDNKFLASIGFAVVSLFSFAAGTITWIVCLVQVILTDSDEKIKKTVVWITCTAVFFSVYLFGYAKPSHHPSLLYSLYNLEDGISTFLNSVGSTIIRDPVLSPIVGLLIITILVFIFIVNRKNLQLEKNSKWFSLVLFSLFASLEVSVARAGFGSSVALSQRYLLLTYWSIIGLYFISLNFVNIYCRNFQIVPDSFSGKDIIKKTKIPNYLLLGSVLCLLFIGISYHFVTGIETGSILNEQFEQNKYYLETFDVQPDKNLERLYPDATAVREKASLLRKYNLSVFSQEKYDLESLKKKDKETQYSVDSINGQQVNLIKDKTVNIVTIITETDEIVIEGWAVDIDENKLARAVFIIVDDKITVPSRYGIKREDLINSLNNKDLLKAGFRASFNPLLLGDGIHRIKIAVVSNDGTGYYIGQEYKYDFS